MRKIVLFAAFACCLVACQTRLEEDFTGVTSIYATMEDGTTKTVLSPGQDGVSSVLWSEADELAVFLDGKSQATPFKLSEGAGTKKAVFKGSGGGSKYVAFYPAKMVSSLSGDNVRITLPVEQQYQEGTFANGSFPMLASGNSPNLSFSNLASILKLSMTGKHSVTRIVFKSAQSSIKVCGQATASVSSSKLTVTSNGRDSLVLTTPGVQLSETQASDFYLVLPPQTYKGGFTVRVYTGERYMDKTITTDFTMERSRMHVADPFVFTPNGVDVSTTLKGSGSESDPFLIEFLGDLIFMRDAVNAGDEINGVAAAEASYKLMADIDLSPVCGEKITKNWEPIGSMNKPFMGSFDGNGYGIEKLYIHSNASYQGLFGRIKDASIAYMSVDGSVRSTGNSVALIVAQSDNSRLSNCSSEGNVSGQGSVGGIVGSGEVNMVIEHCINRARVEGDSYVGGVVGITYYNVISCINRGSVNGSYSVGGVGGCLGGNTFNCSNFGAVSGTNPVGGIVGNKNDGIVANSRNDAPVSGRSSVGGIAGYARQRSHVWNNVNRGKVSGEAKIGGICGELSSNSCREEERTNLQNCLNLGVVEATGNELSIGAICGLNEGYNEQYNFEASELTQSYWLYDEENNLGMATGIGKDEGVSGNNYSLTDEQMKGAECPFVLFSSYSSIFGAMNAFAYSKLNYFNFPLWGWTKDTEDGYPILTGMDAQRPGEEKALFSVTPSEIEVKIASSWEIIVSVKSSLDYTVEVPDWIEKGDVKSYETDPYTKSHSFVASENNSESKRNGVIVFTNTEGKVLQVKVTQPGKYLKVDASSLVISQAGNIRRFNIASSLSWTVTSDGDWFSVSSWKGTGDETISVMATPNDGEKARTATITVSSADGSFVQKIAVIQSGKKPDDGSGEEPQSDEWKELPFIHQSVAMRFTATWCGWCPRMNKTIKKAQELYPDKIQHIALHGGGSDLQFNKVDPLMNQYSISGFPTGVIDGRIEVNNGEINATANEMVRIVKETESTYGTVTGVDISSSVSGSDASVSVNVYVKKAGDYKITVLLLEDGIVNAQTDYEDGDHAKYTHDCVARVAMSNVLGDAFNAPDDFSIVHFDYEASVPAACNLDHVRVLVYVQRAFGTDSIIQTSGSYGKYFIDNCATVELGSDLRLALEGGSGGGGGGEGSGDENEGITPGGEIDM